MALVPVSAGASQVTAARPSPGLAATSVGAPGAPAGAAALQCSSPRNEPAKVVFPSEPVQRWVKRTSTSEIWEPVRASASTTAQPIEWPQALLSALTPRPPKTSFGGVPDPTNG